MNTPISIRALAGLALSALLLAACGGAAAPAPTAAPAAPAKPAAAAVVLDLGTKGDELAFDKTALSAPASSKITFDSRTAPGLAAGCCTTSSC